MKSKMLVAFGLLLGTILAAIGPGASGVARADTDAGAYEIQAPERPDFVYFVSVRIKPDQVLGFKDLAMPYIDETREEPGCLSYMLHQSPENPTEFAVYEHWQSDEARKAHLAAPYTVRFFAATKAMLEAGYPVRNKFVRIK